MNSGLLILNCTQLNTQLFLGINRLFDATRTDTKKLTSEVVFPMLTAVSINTSSKVEIIDIRSICAETNALIKFFERDDFLSGCLGS